jgi:hypothetical protein
MLLIDGCVSVLLFCPANGHATCSSGTSPPPCHVVYPPRSAEFTTGSLPTCSWRSPAADAPSIQPPRNGTGTRPELPIRAPEHSPVGHCPASRRKPSSAARSKPGEHNLPLIVSDAMSNTPSPFDIRAWVNRSFALVVIADNHLLRTSHVKKLNNPRLQRILCTHYRQSLLFDQLFEKLGTMS